MALLPHDLAPTVTQLQNDYAHAIDTRDWDLFRSVFTDDVEAVYTGLRPMRGIKEWLEFFIPFHNACSWTLHVMTNHRITVDARDDVQATCIGTVTWAHDDQPDTLHRSSTAYRDTLAQVHGQWRIVRRQLDVVYSEKLSPVPAHITLPMSLLSLTEQA